MKKLTMLMALCVMVLCVSAETYTRVTKFDKIGTNFQDTFLVVCEYAGNAYIFDGQNEAGRNYVLVENFSGNQLIGNYADNECVLLHNQWHAYDKLCSMLCKGDGERAGGYYLGGVGGGNGIQFSNGQLDVEITWQGEFGIDIVSKTGGGKFQFNTADKVFKFYSQSEQTRPVLFVKGNGGDYVGEDETTNILDINYVQADLYARYSDFSNNLYFWDLRLNQSESETTVPRVETSIQTSSMTALAGNYSQTTPSTQAGWATASSYIQFPSSEEGGTQAKLTTLELTLTPVSRYDEKWYNYHIVLNCIDSNKKRWKLDKVLPIVCTFTDRDPNNQNYDLETDYEYVMDENLPTAITLVAADALQVYAVDGMVYGADNMRIFNLIGQDVTRLNGCLKGIYIVRIDDKTAKLLVP
ncbi:MAG: hypothetical protein ACI392_08420 [Paludibacteraceae bacterium]